ncbi:TetR family transcriptional regulator C-terminal domain-containing protein [Defluviimonas sp. WL0002]|uniref:TetR family transcriptional regulator C-terminal domain-containing protein n=1 Tax=Albidovulum marisflavi TaxID=2984159 RepID=A0ABT2ZD08_9RHOB|nr:TetR family transcriptional regulator C-terminal domain-containing protein [Defluviimonas sp. WL0002]MCV2869007.1 TetR family transcriptional regulator C-terminal domain-containing protein [Defluviimonas sp. WL0002]
MDTDTPLSPTSRRMQARIIEAVIDTVAEHGISATTLALVAQTAGVSQGVLVFHFRSKEGLLTATLRRQNAEYRDLWLQAQTKADPLDRVLALLRADYSPEICTRRTLALWFAFWGEAAARPVYRDLCEAAERDRAQAMEQAAHDLVAIYGGPDAGLLARAVDSMTDGLWLQMHLHGARMPRKRALEQALAHLRLLMPHLADRI